MVYALLVLAVLVAQGSPANPPSNPILKPAPGEGGAEPGWSRALKLDDGRTFVTDGAMSIDATAVKATKMPAQVISGAGAQVMVKHLAATPPNEYRLSQLSSGPIPRSYSCPNGVLLNAGYVDYLRRVLPANRVRLRVDGTMQPVLIVLDERPIGVVMPMVGPKKP